MLCNTNIADSMHFHGHSAWVPLCTHHTHTDIEYFIFFLKVSCGLKTNVCYFKGLSRKQISFAPECLSILYGLLQDTFLFLQLL
jgi:hypothetical protein